MKRIAAQTDDRPSRPCPALAILAVPLATIAAAPALSAPSRAVSICTSEGARTIYVPVERLPSVPDRGEEGCAHFACPRDRDESQRKR